VKHHLASFFIDGTIVPLFRYVMSRVSPPAHPTEAVFRLVTERAAASSADYIEAHLGDAMLFPTREQLWDHALGKAGPELLYAEFGVFDGHSINHMAQRLAARGLTIHGFDSFEGLKEDWHGTWHAAGDFDLGGKMPKVQSNVRLVKGWFDATVPGFLEEHPGPFAFIHFDADTYEATQQLLSLLKGRIVSGTVIVFDEYLGFPNWRNCEFLAWAEFVKAAGLNYRYLAFSNSQAALQVV
jgi:hypothetical protein